MAIKIDELSDILIQAGIADPALRSKVIKEAEALEKDKRIEAEENKAPKAKSKFVIFVRGDEALKKSVQAGWITKIPENSDTSDILQRIQKAGAMQNKASKRQKTKVINYLDFFGFCKRKFTKQVNIQPVTKEAVEVVVLTTEEIPY
jgi:hypothetical protein